jgi:RNA polymerase sigma factor (sigma-70 family)
MEEPKPLMLSAEERARIQTWVNAFLPPEYDREFIADTIILSAWTKEVPHVSKRYVRNKCISARRQMKRERKLNEEAARVGGMRSKPMLVPGTEKPEQEESDREMLVEEAVGKLTPLERRLIWMRYWDGQTLAEIAEQVRLNEEGIRQALDVALYKMRVHLT